MRRLLAFPLLMLGVAPATSRPQLPDRAAVLQYAAGSGEGVWQRATSLAPGLASRDLYLYALALCEAQVHPERLQRLLEVGARMQDRDPESRGYGNFRWSWEHGAVLDFNAVDFCMQAAAVVWLRHRDGLPPEARRTLAETLDYAVEGSLRHRVPESYTNIALMNAGNLILLGEGLDRPEAADEGYARLDRVCLYTWEFGTHEYCSPTYYGVDLDCLGLIEALAGRDAGRREARALLELLWTDIAANWFEPAARLAGTHSRDYDYLHGLGYLDNQLWANRFLAGDLRGSIGAVLPALARWEVPDAIRGLTAQHPRLVRQSWGISATHSRTHYVLSDVTLSTSGATYGTMDLPLTVDLPGPRDQVRGYFIADGRRDPYGQKKIPEGSGPHQKTLHLTPFFCAAQRGGDALALVVYRGAVDASGTLETHFVFPRGLDGLWVGDQPMALDAARPVAVPLPSGEVLVLRKGTAAIGLRVPWARDLEGGAAPVALVDDGNDFGALRLTVGHHGFWGVVAPGAKAAAVLWVRIGSGLATDESFAQWRAAFAGASATVHASADGIRAEAAGAEGPVVVASAAPYAGASAMDPPPYRGVLEVNGVDLGRRILGGVEPIKSFEAQRAAAPTTALSVGTGIYVEAEAGHLVPTMVVGEDAEASGGRFVWMPGEAGEQKFGEGSATWLLDVPREGTYYVWGRVLAPTPSEDSFYVRVFSPLIEPVSQAEWHLGTHPSWAWEPLKLDKAPEPTPLLLPAGEVSLQLRVREDGTKIDRLCITPDPLQEP